MSILIPEDAKTLAILREKAWSRVGLAREVARLRDQVAALAVTAQGHQRGEAEWRALRELENAATLVRTLRRKQAGLLLEADALDVMYDKLDGVERARQGRG